jgi:hypothetical protein
MDTNLSALSDSQLLDSTHAVVRRSNEHDAELLTHLAEIDHRKLYLELGFPSMFALCVTELGFSEDAACNKIAVARLTRQLPTVLDFVRTGRIHLTGLRLLAPALTQDNAAIELAHASGKTRREIEEQVARLLPHHAASGLLRATAPRSTCAQMPVPLEPTSR